MNRVLLILVISLFSIQLYGAKEGGQQLSLGEQLTDEQLNLGEQLTGEQLYNRGVELYKVGNFISALESFKEVEQQGYLSWQLLYNMANCYHKLEERGRAILYYERALKLNPSEEDILFNLNFAREFIVDKIEEIPQFVLVTWIENVRRGLSSNWWVVLSLLSLLISFAFFLSFRHSSTVGKRKLSFFIALLFVLLFIIATLFSRGQKREYLRGDEAIILSPVTTVKNGPDHSGSTLFVLHEGSKVKVLESVGSWSRVELADGRQGWLSKEQIEII